jgi:ATP-binding cassette subfamily C (CFTR/MRP) protein 4
VHTNSTLEGLSTVRSSEMQNVLVNEFDSHADYHTRAYFGFIVVHRWFGLRLDMLCTLYTVIIMFGCIFLRDSLGLTSGEIGILMTYLLQLFNMFQWCMVLVAYIDNFVRNIYPFCTFI